ncbi:hypothetical protein ELUCI_v1c08740 [Williamsoniiplasma lucivorax]|uniref:Uncharacterized protein n=2 Tax=Williamsoniiplasma lucivorax TaxID=209274 RepID=A0A2S5R9U2_9MOLU|nr:hypothetical protein ELUCI_v1c08740 [Williamsoniiplasma lucivorax]
MFKLFSFTACALILGIGLIYAFFIDYWYVDPVKDGWKIAYPRLYNINVIMSFWSVQTNVLVLLWFGFALFKHNQEQKSKFTNIVSQTNITVYITVTMFLFWGAIVGNMLGQSMYDFKNNTTSDVVVTVLTHLFTPLLMIVYYVLNIGHHRVYWRWSWTIFIYPILYCIFSYVRAEILKADGIRPGYFIYAYPFLNFDQPLFGTSLALSNFVTIFGLASLMGVLCAAFSLLNNLFYKHNLKKGKLVLTTNQCQCLNCACQHCACLSQKRV